MLPEDTNHRKHKNPDKLVTPNFSRLIFIGHFKTSALIIFLQLNGQLLFINNVGFLFAFGAPCLGLGWFWSWSLFIKCHFGLFTQFCFFFWLVFRIFLFHRKKNWITKKRFCFWSHTYDHRTDHTRIRSILTNRTKKLKFKNSMTFRLLFKPN